MAILVWPPGTSYTDLDNHFQTFSCTSSHRLSYRWPLGAGNSECCGENMISWLLLQANLETELLHHSPANEKGEQQEWTGNYGKTNKVTIIKGSWRVWSFKTQWTGALSFFNSLFAFESRISDTFKSRLVKIGRHCLRQGGRKAKLQKSFPLQQNR